jgi:hypothetical protein
MKSEERTPMSTEKRKNRTGTADEGASASGPPEAAGAEIQDMVYAIRLLRLRLHEAATLSEKLRVYNQIKTLQDNISRLRRNA